MSEEIHSCRICGTRAAHTIYRAREMMYGTRKEFDYFQCGTCRCLQIARIPADLGAYYPEDYTAHQRRTSVQRYSFARTFAHFLQKQRCRAALFDRHTKLNRVLARFVDYPDALHGRPNDVQSVGDVLRTAAIKRFDAPMLDVGCGAHSYWLENLEAIGFTNLVGIDPLVPQAASHGKVSILPTDLSGVAGRYALITLHHSLEHIPQQDEVMTQIFAHLLPDGVCMIRIPIVPSAVWERYGTDWVELDPPRHLYLHSVESLNRLARAAGLEVLAVSYDSTAFELYGSEMYRRDIPLTDPRSPWIDSTSTLFSAEEMAGFRTSAQQANDAGQGGRAAFFLRKARA